MMKGFWKDLFIIIIIIIIIFIIIHFQYTGCIVIQ